MLVCRDVPDRAAAEALAERIAMGVAHPSVVLAGVAEVTASIGVALAGHLDERPESVLRRAIKAGNHARALGGARIEISDVPVTTTIVEGELAAGIARDELVLHYLPIVSCATGRVAGFEALVRWDHPEHGLLLPGRVPARCRADRCHRADRHVVDRARVSPDGGLARRRRLDAEAEPQPLGAAVRGAHDARAGEAHHRRDRARARIGVVGDHRGHAVARPRRQRPDPAPPPRDRRAPGDRRLRHRRVVAGLAEAVPARRDQDRLDVRGRPRSRPRQRRHLQRDHRPRPLTRALCDRRGRRDPRAVRGIARARLRARAGSSLRRGAVRPTSTARHRPPPWAWSATSDHLTPPR